MMDTVAAAQAVRGRALGGCAAFRRVTTDSRDLEPGDLFGDDIPVPSQQCEPFWNTIGVLLHEARVLGDPRQWHPRDPQM